jgi:hypothetical protein
MKSTRIMVLLRIVVVVLVFATPAIARTETASAGFTWDDNVATSTDLTPVDGFTWDDNVATSADLAPVDGFTWDDNVATSTDLTPEDGFTWDDSGDAAAVEPDAAAIEPSP